MTGVSRLRMVWMAVAVGACVIGPSTVAEAAVSARTYETAGACSARPYFANFRATYWTGERFDNFVQYTWEIGGPLGSRSNVEIRVKHDISFGPDPIYYTWISGDDIGPGINSRTSPRIGVPKDKPSYVEFKFVFDRPGKSDPVCTGTTRRV